MKSYNDMLIQKQSRNKTIQKERNIHYGLDTETLNGKCYLITYASREKADYLYLDVNEEDTKGIYDILEFLTLRRFRNSLNWFYNLDYDVRAIMRWMEEKNIAELYNTKETDIGKYHITFLSKKFFTIRKNKETFSYYDIMQFYPGGLDLNAEKYLGIGKTKEVSSKILGSSKKYWLDHHKEIVKYCINDSLITGMLGSLLYTNLWKALKFNPIKPFSAGSISQEFFINECKFIPTITGIPNKILEIHQNNYRGGRIEILKRGFFNDVYSYDLSSAYPAEMVNLMDYANGIWIKSKDFDEKYHGMYKVKFNWFNPDLGFIAFTSDKKTLYPNVENSVSWINEKELCFLNNNSKFNDFEVLEGYTFKPYQEVYPYRDLILKLYDLKQNATDKNERMLYKLFINSIYGKTAQAIYDKNEGKFKTGKLYNPLYSCRITANTRLTLLKNALPISKDVIGFSTDSIQTLNPNVKTGDKLGDFEYEYCASEGVILMSGIRYMDDMQKMRGFNAKLENGDKMQLKQILQDNLDKSIIKIIIEKPITIFQGMTYKKFCKDDINIFNSENRYLDINGDYRRLWADDFENAEDVFSRYIDSSPYFLEEISNP